MEDRQPFQKKVFFPNPCYVRKERRQPLECDSNVVMVDEKELIEPNGKRIRLGEAPDVHLQIINDARHSRQLEQSQLSCPHITSTSSSSSTKEILEMGSSVKQVMEQMNVILEEAKTLVRHGVEHMKPEIRDRHQANTTKCSSKKVELPIPKSKNDKLEKLKPKTNEFPTAKSKAAELIPKSRTGELPFPKLSQRRKRESEFGNIEELYNHPRVFKPARRLLEYEVEAMDCTE